MRLFYTILLIVCCDLLILASDTSIVFRQTSYDDIFDLAKKENKDVLLYFHFEGCGSCKVMEQTVFNQPAVYEYFNQQYVSLSVDIKTPEGKPIADRYITGPYPSFIFLNSDGQILHKVADSYDTTGFLEVAQIAKSKTENLSYYKNQFETGRRNADFLYRFCYKLRDAGELDSSFVNTYLRTQSNESLFEEKNIRFMYEFAFHWHKVFIPQGSREFEFLKNQKSRFASLFGADQVDARIVFILSTELYNSIKLLDENKFDTLLAELEPYDNGSSYGYKEMDGRLTMMTNATNLCKLYVKAYKKEARTMKK